MKHENKRSAGSTLVLLGLGAIGAYAGWRFSQQVQIAVRNQRLRRGRTIVILGAGFAGRHVALELARQLPESEDGQIVLIDREAFLLFTPMLTEAAGGELDIGHIVSPATQLPPRITFMQGQVESIDLDQREVTFLAGEAQAGIPQSRRTLNADHLVLALGAVTNFHDIPGLQEHSFAMKSLADATTLRNRALALLERASEEPDGRLRQELLTLVVGGAGLTGVETMAALNDLLRESVRKFPRLNPQEIQTVLVHSEGRILPELSPSLARYAQYELEQHGVQVRLEAKITGAGADYVELNGTERIPTRTLIWAGGVEPNPLIRALDGPRGHHSAVVVDAHLAVPGHPGVWALGDSAQVPKPEGDGFYAPTAQNAVREGTLVARNIAAALRGDAPERFRFQPLGQLALVGRHAGVARILGFQFKGLTAWAMWRFVYWSKMPNLAQRMRILSDWLLDIAFGRRIAPLPLSPGQLKPYPERELGYSPPVAQNVPAAQSLG